MFGLYDFAGVANVRAARQLKTLYNITVVNAMAQRCKESAFIDKESRFFTMVFNAKTATAPNNPN
jgi:hypothetical protein